MSNTEAPKIKLFEPFDVTKSDEVVTYFERFELFCETMKIPSEKWAVTLLSSMGGEAYSKFKTLITPMAVRYYLHDYIKKTLITHYNPRHLIIMERHNFRERKQKEGESFRDFLVDLKKLSQHCGFQNNIRLEEELMEQVVRGIKDDRLRTRFLGTPDLTLEKVIQQTLTDEKAQVYSDSLKVIETKSSSQISRANANYTKNNFANKGHKNMDSRGSKYGGLNSNNRDIVCYRCGKQGHPRSKCRVDKYVKCYKCKKTGHLAVICMW